MSGILHSVLLGLKHDRRGVENKERDEIEISVETALQVAKDIGIISLCCIESLVVMLCIILTVVLL